MNFAFMLELGGPKWTVATVRLSSEGPVLVLDMI